MVASRTEIPSAWKTCAALPVPASDSAIALASFCMPLPTSSSSTPDIFATFITEESASTVLPVFSDRRSSAASASSEPFIMATNAPTEPRPAAAMPSAPILAIRLS